MADLNNEQNIIFQLLNRHSDKRFVIAELLVN